MRLPKGLLICTALPMAVIALSGCTTTAENSGFEKIEKKEVFVKDRYSSVSFYEQSIGGAALRGASQEFVLSTERLPNPTIGMYQIDIKTLKDN